MRKTRILLILGIWVAVLPYLGFPYSWKDILTTLSGLGLIYFSYIFYKDYKAKSDTETFDSFKENSDFNENKNENEDGSVNEPVSDEVHSNMVEEI